VTYQWKTGRQIKKNNNNNNKPCVGRNRRSLEVVRLSDSWQSRVWCGSWPCRGRDPSLQTSRCRRRFHIETVSTQQHRTTSNR